MVEANERVAIKTKRLNLIVDDIFDIYEHVYKMLKDWKQSYHMPFIEQVMRLQQLEAELSKLGYDEYFVCILKQTIYHTVFANG